MGKIIGKKRFWLLNFAILAIIIISFFYISAVGSHYDLHTNIYLDDSIEYTVQAEFSQEGVIEYTDTHLEDGQIVFSLKSIAKGKTDAVFTITTNEGAAPQYRTFLRVNTLGTIFEHSEIIFNFSGYRVIALQIILILLLTMGMMIYTVLDMQKKAQYSYPMIAAGGLALFSAILIAFLVYKSLNNVVTSFSVFVSMISETGTQFLLAMTPVMLVLAVALSVSNIWLLRNEGYRPVNALGILFSAVWVIGMLVSFGLISTHVIHINNRAVADSLNKAFIYLCCYFECMLLSTVVCAYSASRHLPPHDRDCIIILGCAIRPDGSPTPLLRMRTDSAIRFEQEQFRDTGRHAVFIPSGGQGSDEVISEAESMRQYLIGQGIDDAQIAVEDKSTSTNENMRFSKAVIEQRLGDITKKKIAFATTNYHVFRGYVLARKNGFEAQGISAKTKWYFFPNAFLREFVGLLADRKLWHILQIVGMIVLFVGLGRIV